MAVTVSDVTRIYPGPPHRLVVAKITQDDAYPTNGEALTASSFGLVSIVNVIPFGTPSGFGYEYVPSTGKLKMYWVDTSVDGAAMAEVTNDADTNAAGWFLVIGN